MAGLDPAMTKLDLAGREKMRYSEAARML